jgi:hypothetical protein
MPQDEAWRVVQIGKPFKGPYSTRDEAIGVAQLLAMLLQPAQVLIYDQSGDLESQTFYTPA